MKNKLMKSTFAALAAVTIGSTVAPVVSAASENEGLDTANENTQILVLPTDIATLPKNSYEDQKWGTGLIKTAIKYILKHPKTVAKTVEKFGGKRAAKAFLNHFGAVKKSLKPLLKYSNLVDKSVYDAVFRGLRNAGLSRSTATKVAEAIKVGLSIFF